MKSLADLKADPRNPRTISEGAIKGLSYSIAEFGDLSGITFNERTGELVCGHQRVKALRAQYGDLPMDDRVEVQPWLAEKGRYSFVTSDPRATNLANFNEIRGLQ